MFKALLIFTGLMLIGIITTGIIAPTQPGALFGISSDYHIAMGIFLALFLLGFGMIMCLVVYAIKIANPLPEDTKA